MSKKSKPTETRQPSNEVAGSGPATRAGQSFRPQDLPEAECTPTPAKPRDVPLGLPISEKEYERLKKEAEKDNRLSGGGAQQDPSARRPDG